MKTNILTPESISALIAGTALSIALIGAKVDTILPVNQPAGPGLVTAESTLGEIDSWKSAESTLGEIDSWKSAESTLGERLGDFV